MKNNEELDFTLALLFYWNQVCNSDYKNLACNSDYKNEKIWDGIFDEIDQMKQRNHQNKSDNGIQRWEHKVCQGICLHLLKEKLGR